MKVNKRSFRQQLVDHENAENIKVYFLTFFIIMMTHIYESFIIFYKTNFTIFSRLTNFEKVIAYVSLFHVLFQIFLKYSLHILYDIKADL